MGRCVLLAAACVLWVCLAPRDASAASFTPIDDDPFPEIFAHRFTSAGSAEIEGWGMLPFRNISQVLVGFVQLSEGVFVVSESGLYFMLGPDGRTSYAVQVGIPVSLNTRVAVGPSKQLVVVANAQTIASVQCYISGSVVQCDTSTLAQGSFGTVTAVAVQTWNSTQHSCYVATANGLLYYKSTASPALANIWSTPTLSAAFSPALNLAAAGDQDFVATFQDGSFDAREWVTDLQTGSGGAYDAPANALLFADDGTLFVATDACINVRYVNASVGRVDYLQGLPYNMTTSLAMEPGTGALWVGTAKGAARWDMQTREWSYYYLQRYLPGASEVASVSCGSTFTAVATDGGLSLLEVKMWTLADKAQYYEVVLARHDRFGLVSDCDLKSFGNYSSCTNGDSDNNGLWTSLVVGAEAFRYAATGNPDAYDLAVHYYGGMRLLNEITGIPGLMARSAVRPGESHSGDGAWHYSTVPKYAGWQWKGDTSSDEVVGHMFAFDAMARFVLTSGPEHDEAVQLLSTIVHYIVKNNFYLIDVTGNHTMWGVWNPNEINNIRFWSDEHGVNSIQILGYLLSAIDLTGDPDGMLRAAYATLTNKTNHFDSNTVNAKILSPDDDNYSDDELTFLPYFTMFSSAGSRANPLFMASLRRTWTLIRNLRSDLWNAIYIAIDGQLAGPQDVESVAWNLRTWPLEQVDWPVQNSIRRDLRFDINADRFGVVNGDSVRVLPANERSQYRWNDNPHNLDGGHGMSECDPGAWLLPYWMARYFHIIV